MAYNFFTTDPFNYNTQLALGGVYSGCGDLGEMLATTARIVEGDDDSWCDSWTAIAERVAATADDCAAAGHPVSARAAYLRASAYYALALSAVDGTRDPSARLLPIFRAHRRCFEAYLVRLDPPGQPVQIPYQDLTLPGYLFRPDTSGRPRPTLIVNNGSDACLTTLWPPLGAGGVARGYNVLVFDGPGQQSMLFERGVPFRYDWEHVITPVVNYLLTRPDVDPTRLALWGISQGGYWAPRALAFEHRLAAGIADPGVYDAFEPWWNALSEPMRRCLRAGDQPGFDHLMQESLQQGTPAQRQNWAWRAKPYGTSSPYEVFVEARRYSLAGVVEAINTPMLITDPEGEQFWPGQSRRLYDAPRASAAGRLHRPGGGGPALRTAGPVTARAARVRLAGPDTGRRGRCREARQHPARDRAHGRDAWLSRAICDGWRTAHPRRGRGWGWARRAGGRPDARRGGRRRRGRRVRSSGRGAEQATTPAGRSRRPAGIFRFVAHAPQAGGRRTRCEGHRSARRRVHRPTHPPHEPVGAVRIIRRPARAPRANASVERWIGTLRRECLEDLLIIGSRHFAAVLQEYIDHYHTHRPHRSLDQGPPLGSTPHAPPPPFGPVRRDRLGGLIHEYVQVA